MIMNANKKKQNKKKKRFIQGRVARAVLVNALPGTRIEALKREGCTLRHFNDSETEVEPHSRGRRGRKGILYLMSA